jgi:hypothetical protein
VALPVGGTSALKNQAAHSGDGDVPIDVLTLNGAASVLSHLGTLSGVVSVPGNPDVLDGGESDPSNCGIPSSGVTALSHRTGVPAPTVNFCNVQSHYLSLIDTHHVTYPGLRFRLIPARDRPGI